ncbi:hypothetical protein [Bacillus zhangzhouensis]|uniref:Uncharacterized protein n=1 Tax=Bacillus zhangzhouensis TaxID=1178540 RepID=A0A081L716_9BACI|nr:hypothetical protein [Bacillus zhangzhouensis]KEP25042.1 hypothetical protein BA70_12355 [Bacillus zhangzhouensis]
MVNSKALFIHSGNEFKEYKVLIEKVFYTNKHLPHQVFRENFNCFLFQEFDWALSDEILTTIKTLSGLTQDKEFLTAVLKPDPVEYYLKEFGYYNWLRTSVEISGKDYANALWTSPEDSMADDIFTNSNNVVWLSNSLDWAIWGDRDLEICILATKSKNYSIQNLLSEDGWKPLNSILKEWLELLFSDGEKFDEFWGELTSNYS